MIQIFIDREKMDDGLNKNQSIGYLDFDDKSENSISSNTLLEDYYKIIYMEKNGSIIVDFVEYSFTENALLFFSIGQHFQISKESRGSIIYFNTDFYCIAFHDKELACDGLLFDNVFELPYLNLSTNLDILFLKLISSIKVEINKKDFWAEEMIKTYIKQIIISATRTLIKSNNDSQIVSYDKELARKFSQLVELHYRTNHNVSDYANMLNITPKNLNRKIVSEKQVAPSIIIKQRIILQAKRLLANTTLSIKEIADYLGYEDYSYFVRFFKSQTGLPPLSFRNAL
ncbi:helix-turn-helix domain-containing protein [Flavobacterium quisquiliarum]|uniref:Helix-turn-helix domain-containing protein n=2 Tax=Flavobacterium TaxID=237 RepID=A0ABV8W0J6_9FLAO|nr:AraC family transcriptional regulator [Flavobacterium quisquiliarum]MBW1658490.1 helix-turn-helix domain-containing protein [Flavobacterium quisquiliarum]